MSQCTATSKRTRERCQRPARIGRTVCHQHGGASPVGLASASYRDGRYSKYLPSRLHERYRASERDPERLALVEEIALLDARMSDVLARVDTGESGELWDDLKDAWEDVLAANRAKDGPAQAAAMSMVGDLIGRGRADWAAWADMRAMLQERRKLVESEGKRQVAMQQMVTSTEAVALATALIAAVRENVTDDAVLVRISDAVVRLVGLPDRGRDRAGEAA